MVRAGLGMQQRARPQLSAAAAVRAQAHLSVQEPGSFRELWDLAEAPSHKPRATALPWDGSPSSPVTQLNPRGDHGGVDSHPARGEQWGPPPWAHLVPSIFMLVPGQRLVAISSLAMCTQPHLLLKKSRCTCQGPSSFE